MCKCVKGVPAPDNGDLKLVARWELHNLHPFHLHEGLQLLKNGSHAVLWPQQHVPDNKALLWYSQLDVDGNGGWRGEMLCQIPARNSNTE